MAEYKEYVGWDAPTRWFHWINALAVICLIGTSLVILLDDALGLEVHELGFYALAVVIVLHLIAVVVTEIRESGRHDVAGRLRSPQWESLHP